ncbi:MAG: hypothetical protein HY053_02235 [Proteobacteria bacterium]|nr:hypothetical protein [Pseudomonadota bacterium]
MLPEKDRLPPSCVGWSDPFIGLAVVLGVFFALRLDKGISDAVFAALMVAALSLFLGTLEIVRAPWRKTKPSAEPTDTIIRRAGLKMLGFFATLAFIGFLYWLFPEYRRAYYKNYFDMVWTILPFIPPIFVVYFLYAEWRFPEYRDGCWQTAMLVLGRWHLIDWQKFTQHILGWIVKGFYLAIMFGDLAGSLAGFRYVQWNWDTVTFKQLFHTVFLAIVTLELVFVSAGYVFSSRLFNSQMRMVEKTLLGWTVALMCYGPFLSLTFTRYLGYHAPGVDWSSVMSNMPTLYYVWGSITLLLLVVHMWCDACFGLRFSNLTNRGIITNGCYRFCKHPAYIGKNIRWWMVNLPFMAGSIEGFRLSLLLLGVNLIYAIRCWAEEKMLSRDPDYQAYGLWMDKHGMFRWFGQLFPFLTYEYRLKKWKEQGALTPMPPVYTHD